MLQVHRSTVSNSVNGTCDSEYPYTLYFTAPAVWANTTHFHTCLYRAALDSDHKSSSVVEPTMVVCPSLLWPKVRQVRALDRAPRCGEAASVSSFTSKAGSIASGSPIHPRRRTTIHRWRTMCVGFTDPGTGRARCRSTKVRQVRSLSYDAGTRTILLHLTGDDDSRFTLLSASTCPNSSSNLTETTSHGPIQVHQTPEINGWLGPFHVAIAVPSVTRCRCRCRGHRCAGGALQYR